MFFLRVGESHLVKLPVKCFVQLGWSFDTGDDPDGAAAGQEVRQGLMWILKACDFQYCLPYI
jgi:hypothetical protein